MKTRPGAFLWAAGVLVAALLGGLAVSSFLDLRSDFERADAQADSRASDVEALRSQLIALGETPDVETPARGETGERGPQGIPGRDGLDATAAQIAATVSSWFNLNSPVDQPDPNDPEVQDAEIQDPEAQDAEVQDDEVDDPEVQDPEIDDPDPNGGGPASFDFQIENRTYTCTDPEVDGHYSCEGSQEAVIPAP